MINSTVPLRRWLNLRFIVFAVAEFNFVLIWLAAHTMPGACVACPWFYPWTYFNEPTLLLIAAVALCAGRRFSSGIALALSGYLIADLIYRMWIYDVTLDEIARQLFSSYQEIVYAWQSQCLVSIAVLMVATFYLVKDHFVHRNFNERHRASTSSSLR